MFRSNRFRRWTLRLTYFVALLNLTGLAHTLVIFDQTKPFSVSGTIVKVDLGREGEETFIHVRVEGKSTDNVVWAFEAPSSTALRRWFNADITPLKEGAKVTVIGWPEKAGANMAEGIKNVGLVARLKTEKHACAVQFEFSDGRKVAVLNVTVPTPID